VRAAADSSAGAGSGGAGSGGAGSAGAGGKAAGPDAWWEAKPAFSLLSVVGTLLAAVIGAWVTGIVGPDRTNAGETARNKQLADTAQAFTPRRVAAVKERLLRTDTATPQERAAKRSDGRTLPLFARPSAMAAVDVIVRTAGLYMFCGPKGEGKSSLMEQLEEANPFVVRVDLQTGSVDKAVRAVAAAMGYSLVYTSDELKAKAAGFTLPEIKALQGVAEFEELLLVFEQACNELRTEGRLGAHVPVLILE